jgi:hypothetical protein
MLSIRFDATSEPVVPPRAWATRKWLSLYNPQALVWAAKSCRETRALARSGQRHVHDPMQDTDHRRLQPHSVVMRAIFLLFSFGPGQAANIYEGSPPVFGAFPTGGPIDGGTSVTIFGREFDQINRFPSEARCSWGDPREWQQAVFAAQQVRLLTGAG